MTCKRASQLIEEMGAGTRPAALPSDVAEHLRGCPACAERLEDELQLTHRLRSAAGSPALSAEADERLRCALVSRPRRRPVVPWLAPVAAAAAAVALIALGASLWWPGAIPSDTPADRLPMTAMAEGPAGGSPPVAPEAAAADAPEPLDPAAEPRRPEVVIASAEPTGARTPAAIPADRPIYTTRPAPDAANRGLAAPVEDSGGWAADGPAPADEWHRAGERTLALDVSTAGLSTEVGLDGLTMDSGSASWAAPDAGSGLSLDVAVTSTGGSGLELEVEAP